MQEGPPLKNLTGSLPTPGTRLPASEPRIHFAFFKPPRLWSFALALGGKET